MEPGWCALSCWRGYVCLYAGDTVCTEEFGSQSNVKVPFPETLRRFELWDYLYQILLSLPQDALEDVMLLDWATEVGEIARSAQAKLLGHAASLKAA
jgi:hypothetical protein